MLLLFHRPWYHPSRMYQYATGSTGREAHDLPVSGFLMISPQGRKECLTLQSVSTSQLAQRWGAWMTFWGIVVESHHSKGIKVMSPWHMDDCRKLEVLVSSWFRSKNFSQEWTRMLGTNQVKQDHETYMSKQWSGSALAMMSSKIILAAYPNERPETRLAQAWIVQRS